MVAALLMKWIGASWDISWHFHLESDANSPAHLTNIIGNGILVVVLLWAWFTRRPEEEGPLVAAGTGLAMVAVAVPADLLWHHFFGLDLTNWSPTHMLLFYGTGVLTVALVFLYAAEAGWRAGSTFRSAGLSRGDWTMLVFLGSRAFAPFFFPAVFNEYAAVAAQNVASGYALYDVEPALQSFAATIHDLPYDDLPHALYPAYMLSVCSAFFVAARRVTGAPFFATGIAALYVASRLASDQALVSIGWPYSAIPYNLLLIALAVDAAWMLQVDAALRGLAAAVGATTLSYAYWAATVPDIPRVPLDWATVPLAFASAAVACTFMAVLAAQPLLRGGARVKSWVPKWLSRPGAARRMRAARDTEQPRS